MFLLEVLAFRKRHFNTMAFKPYLSPALRLAERLHVSAVLTWEIVHNR